MNYNDELKNKKTWVLVIKPHRYDEKDNRPQLKVIKFNMPVPPPIINGRKVKNCANDARIVWDDLFAWKYGNRAMDIGIDFMMNIQDINRAIHTKVNFVSLIEKTPKQIKKEGLSSETQIITPDKKKIELLRQNELKNNFREIDDNSIIRTTDKCEHDVLNTITNGDFRSNVHDWYMSDTDSLIKVTNPNCMSIPVSNGITDDTKPIQNIVDENLAIHHIKDIRNNEIVNLRIISKDNIIQDISESKLPRIKPAQRFMEDMKDKHLDPMVKKLVKVEERLTDDKYHNLRSKYVRMFDKKSLDKVPDVDEVKNFWYCKTYLWRTNGKGVINIGYAIYSTDELYSYKRLIDEETIALKMEVQQWNKRISNEI